jgi:hypothetical protein
VVRIGALLDDFLGSDIIARATSTAPVVVKSIAYRSTPTVPPSPSKRGGRRKHSGLSLKIGSLETQEILLFSLSHFVLELCFESHQVRALLRTGLVEEFTSIMTVLNIVCPRPTGDGDEVLLPLDYGPALYGMTSSAWLLLVEARCAIEEILSVLGISLSPVPVAYRAAGPLNAMVPMTSADENASRKLSKDIVLRRSK